MIQIKEGLFDKAIEKYGKEFQFEMAIEECSELIHAIQKKKRKNTKGREKHIWEEVADVKLILEVLIYIIGEDKIQPIVNFKSDRLENRINEKS